jgi:glutathione S-transferase
MAYRLYGRRQSGSMAIEAALTICGADWVLVDTPRHANQAERAAFLKINRRGQVPALIHPDGTVITEGPAILSHLADAFPAAGLAPLPGSSDRARQDRWVAFFHANIYEGMLRELAPGRYTDEPGVSAPIATAATAYVRRHFEIFEAESGQTGALYLSGKSLSALDIYVWMLCFWLDRDWLVSSLPKLSTTWVRLCQHPVLSPIEQAHFG